MADREENRSTGETRRSSNKKDGGLLPKERKHVSQMVGEKIAETISSGLNNIVKNKNKVNPSTGSED